MSVPERLLLHTCCGPCLIAPYYQLKEEGVEVTAFWYNPNIHPYTEYKLRLEALRDFAAQEPIKLFQRDEYGLREFVANVAKQIDDRCEYCYATRLEATAKLASEQGFDAFSTTLLYSRYQKHERIVEIADAMAEKYQVPFFYRDWRPLWEEGIRLSKESGMYRQKYCGCIFSEEERYLRRKQ
ncbi:MAG TPA: epoxyqueuosine reductase QueH [Candidatus Cloacimonadota bacterium]|jgi:hypothetical protein|nr:epoxyqueuosine reductase QueH [Candidatus Cloacimonadota bacterium]HOF59318.1 epoxyqueuosine reductase QueH [Candidatus Cloacimonadota bacterium]HOR58363.1 epoxyqueuosine reductase QueH [Candidatus Cloacimonadota bacterium]HPB08725.1 epoxyqueuosine reductase QueH [Candidatus Cloacimonadota bacterium]HPL23488.1 epoxyqueuosine reductase QueH [Candidatus Cloacimonadota bacterium]